MSTLGRIYLSEQRFAEAAEVFREALSYWPRSRALYGSLIDALLRAGEPAETEAAIDEFLAIDANSIRARLTLADLRRERGDTAAAVAVLVETPRGASGDRQLYRRLAIALYEALEFEAALFWLDRSLEVDGSGTADLQGRFLRALLLTAGDRDGEARIELEAILDEDPQRRDALGLLVRHDLQVENWEAARERLAGHLEGDLDDEDGELAMLYAEALDGAGRKAEALDFLARAASIGGIETQALARQAEILLEMDRAAEADALLAELTADPTTDNLLVAAEVCQRLEDYARSIPFLERVVADGPQELQALFWLGAAYERTGRVEEAEIQFLRFLELQPDSAPALNYLGYMWADNGLNLSEALAYVQKAVELDPDNGAYIDSLGWAHFRLGDYQEARSHLERAAVLVGEDPVVLEHLGDVYAALGEVEDALRLYKQALDLDAENAAALRDKLRRLSPR